MRRTNGLIVGACTALALAATAGASAWATRTPAADPRPFASDSGTATAPGPTTRAAPAPAAAPTTAAGPTAAAAPTGGGRVPKATSSSEGREQVGTVQAVGKLLRYATGARTEKFSYPGADYVKLHFDRLVLLPGDYVTVSDPKKTEVHRYDAPPLAQSVLGGSAADTATGRWAMSVTGDTAVLEVHRGGSSLLGLGNRLNRLSVGVDKVARGYTPAEKATAPAGPGREESVCGGNQSADAVCYKSADPVAYTRSQATARLLINGTELCTGWRIGAKNNMMTNNHCFSTSADAYDTEVWFNYACAKCGGYDVFRPTKVWGHKVVVTNKTLDFTMFTVENFATVQKFGYLNLDLRRPAKKEELYVPQNPAGEPTMIAGTLGSRAGNCAVEDPLYDGYAKDSDVSYYCDTEGGSSGSPVLSRTTDKVLALHHFGGCPNSGVRADLIYPKIKSFL